VLNAKPVPRGSNPLSGSSGARSSGPMSGRRFLRSDG
jgi:hypothetical protein